MKIIKKALISALTASLLFGLDYNYLPPMPLNYVKSYSFAFDFKGSVVKGDTNTTAGTSFGISMRKIYNFDSSSDLEYSSDWNYGLKGDLDFYANSAINYTKIDIGPTLGYNFTNHLNGYISGGMIGIYKSKDSNNSNNSTNDKIGTGGYGEVGLEYFINDDIDFFCNYQREYTTNKIIDNDNSFSEINLGFKITYR